MFIKEHPSFEIGFNSLSILRHFLFLVLVLTKQNDFFSENILNWNAKISRLYVTLDI